MPGQDRGNTYQPRARHAHTQSIDMSASPTNSGASPPAEEVAEGGKHVSWWPPVAALGAAGLYGGIALTLLGRSAGVFPPVVGVGLAAGGGLVVSVALFGWIWEAYVGPYERLERSGRERHVTTMLLFLATDLGTFGSLIAYYGFVRVGAWPPTELPALLGSLLLVNTLILLTSSATFHLAHRALDRDRRSRFLGLLGVTVVLGAGFLIGQAIEYATFVLDEGFTLTSGVYASAFFGLTGLHGLHVALGVVLLTTVFIRAVRGQYSPDRDTSVATVGLYWHFVDLVWLVLVALLYVGAAVRL